MLLADAQNRLKALTASSTEPTLSPTEIDALLTQYALFDYNGLAPTDPDWEGTWNFNSAAREGWLIKAGRVSDLFDFGSDVNNFKRDQLFKHCTDMADKFATMKYGTMELSGATSWLPVIGNYNDIGE